MIQIDIFAVFRTGVGDGIGGGGTSSKVVLLKQVPFTLTSSVMFI